MLLENLSSIGCPKQCYPRRGFRSVSRKVEQTRKLRGRKRIETLRELLAWGVSELAILGSVESQSSAERLLSEVAGLARSVLYLDLDRSLSPDPAGVFRSWICRRKSREPLAYILGRAYFWEEILEVGRGCLIPRPETEILVEQFIKRFEAGREKDFSFLDLGCGSGAIGLAILRRFPLARATFADISQEALKITRVNLERYQVLARAELVPSDLFEAFQPRKTRWDAIVCNPPYLSAEDWGKVEPELLWEPYEALDGGRDGFYFYRRICKEAPSFLKVGGCLVLEVGIHQAGRVHTSLARTGRFHDIRLYKDYQGLDRILIATMN